MVMVITINAKDTGMFSEDFISEFGNHVDIEIPDDILENFFNDYVYDDALFGIDDDYDYTKEDMFALWIGSLDNYEDDNISDIWSYCIEHGVNPIITDIW